MRRDVLLLEEIIQAAMSLVESEPEVAGKQRRRYPRAQRTRTRMGATALSRRVLAGPALRHARYSDSRALRLPAGEVKDPHTDAVGWFQCP